MNNNDELTVTMPIERYNKLIEIEKNIIELSKGYTQYTAVSYPHGFTEFFRTNESVIGDLTERLKTQGSLFKSISDDNFSMSNNLFRTKEALTKVSKMSVWQFLKWRRKQSVKK